MKLLFYLLAGFSVGYITLVLSSFHPHFAILVPVTIITLILSKSDMLKCHLAFCFSAGIIIDIANQNRFPFEAIFLILVVLATDHLRSRFIDLSNKLILVAYYMAVSILYIAFHFLFYYHAISFSVFLYCVLADFIIFALALIAKESYKVSL